MNYNLGNKMMNTIKPLKILPLNLYSWFLIIVYLAAVLTMEYHSYAAHWEGFFLSSPLIIMIIIWSEMTYFFHTNRKAAITKIEIFNEDLFLLTFSMITGELLSFLFQHKNIDLLGWWPLVIYFMAIYGFLFAFVFSLLAMGLNTHKKYTFIYCILILLFLPILNFLAYIKPFSIFASGYYLFPSILIGVHLLFVLEHRILLLLRKNTSP